MNTMNTNYLRSHLINGLSFNNAVTELGKKIEKKYPGILVEKNWCSNNDVIYVKQAKFDSCYGSSNSVQVIASMWEQFLSNFLKGHSADDILVKTTFGEFIPFSKLMYR